MKTALRLLRLLLLLAGLLTLTAGTTEARLRWCPSSSLCDDCYSTFDTPPSQSVQFCSCSYWDSYMHCCYGYCVVDYYQWDGQEWYYSQTVSYWAVWHWCFCNPY